MTPDDITQPEPLEDILNRQPDKKTALEDIVQMVARGQVSAFKQDGKTWIEPNKARHDKINSNNG